MTGTIRLEPWLALSLFILVVGGSPGQEAAPKKPVDDPEVKLPALLSAKPLVAGPRDDALRKLLKARYNEAVSEAREHYAYEKLASERGIALLRDQGRFYRMWERVVQAGLELCDTPAEKVALLAQYLDVTREVERQAQAEHAAGRIKAGELHRARYARLDAEVRLLRAKREADRAKKR
jgi:hypothetical protein